MFGLLNFHVLQFQDPFFLLFFQGGVGCYIFKTLSPNVKNISLFVLSKLRYAVQLERLPHYFKELSFIYLCCGSNFLRVHYGMMQKIISWH